MATLLVPGSRRQKLARSPERLINRGTRAAGPDRTVLLIEQEPQVRRTRWLLGGRAQERSLSMPRLLFPIVFWRQQWEKTCAFVLAHPCQGPEVMLYRFPLPNIFSSGKVCVGGVSEERLALGTRAATGWDAKAQVVLEDFWSTYFNDHLIDHLHSGAPAVHPALASLASWERASRTQPNFVHHCTWAPMATVRDTAFADA